MYTLATQTVALMQEAVLAVLEGTARAEVSLEKGVWGKLYNYSAVLGDDEDIGQVQPLIQEICDSWEEGKAQRAATLSIQIQDDTNGANWKPRITMPETGKQRD